MSASREELLLRITERVNVSPASDVDAAVSDEDIAAIARLDDVAREGAVNRLCALGVSKRLLRQRVKAALALVHKGPVVDGWRADLRRNRDGDVQPAFDNLCSVLRNDWRGRLSYNTMALRPYLDGAPLDDFGVSSVREQVSRTWGASWGKEDIGDAIALVGRQEKPFNPVAEYLHGLKWDGKPRLNSAAKTHLLLGDHLSSVMLRRTLISAVARGLVHEHAPTTGTMVKTVPIILGYQDAKKSTFFKTIGSPYFGDSTVDITDRKGLMSLSSRWIYEMPEIDGMLSRHSNERTKAFTSQSYDDFVPMFGRSSVTVVRSWIMVGTTNKERFLTDPTGSSRWWVLDIRPNGADWEVDRYLLEQEKDQLFAESVEMFSRYLKEQRAGVRDDENPYRWWMSREENRSRADAATAYQVEDGWAEPVGRWLAGLPVRCPACHGRRSSGLGACSQCGGGGTVARGPLPVDASGREYVTAGMILGEALGIPEERQRAQGGTVAATLVELGWVAGPRMRPGGARGPQVTPYYHSPPAPRLTGEDDGRDPAGVHVEMAPPYAPPAPPAPGAP